MNFIAPAFLYALFLLAIPILIHLFNFRKYKTVYFPQVKFLREVKKESKSASQLKHLLVLASRLLALAAIITAFAQPYGSKEDQNLDSGKKRVQVYIDNSFSMQADDGNGQLLESAKQKIYQISNIYSEADEFQLMSNDFFNSSQNWLNKSDFIERVQNVEFSTQQKNISQIINRFSEDYQSDFDYDVYLLSDLQKSGTDIETIDTAVDITLLPLIAERSENIALIDLKFEKPFHLANSKEEIEFQLRSYTNNSETISVVSQLYTNGVLNTPFTIEMGINDSINSKVSFTNNTDSAQSARLIIKDFPIQFDDTLFFNLELSKKINLSHIYENDAYSNIEAIYKSDSLFNYIPIPLNSIDYSLMEGSSTILLEPLSKISTGMMQFLEEHIKKGNSVALVLDNRIDLVSYNQLLANLNLEQLLDLNTENQEIKSINPNAELFQGVFEKVPKNLKLPTSDQHYLISNKINSRKEDILVYQNNIAAIREYTIANGKLTLINIPLNDSISSFSRNALFVPIFYNLALFSSKKSPLYYTLGEPIIIELDEVSESPLRIKGKSIDIIPKQKKLSNSVQLYMENQIQKAGQYEIYQGEKKLQNIALNYNRKESDFTCYRIDELEDIIEERNLKIRTILKEGESLVNEIQYLMKGEPYWKYFVILALLFLAIETILIRIL